MGWIFYANYSPDGNHVAVSWNREIPDPDGKGFGLGLWVISLQDASRARFLASSSAVPFDWSGDGRWVYAVEFDPQESNMARFFRIPAESGTPEIVFEFDWPLERPPSLCVGREAEARWWICAVTEVSSDLWLVENFDPDLD